MKKVKMQMYTLILVTFISGVMIGGLGTGWFIKCKVQRLRTLATAEGMSQQTLQLLSPIPDDKMPLVQQLVQQNAEVITALRNSSQRQTRQEVDALEKNLERLLGDESLKAFREEKSKWRKIIDGRH